MAANARSLRLTEAYRARLFSLRARLEQLARQFWPSIDELDDTDWVERAAVLVAQSQGAAITLTSGYLSAFLTTELGEAVVGPSIDSETYSGLSRDGRPLTESLRSPLIGTLGRLKQGDTPEAALNYGLNRASRMVGMDFDHAHRTALVQTIDSDPRFDGWSRAIRGGCGACAAKAKGLSHDLWFPVHPGCFIAGTEVSGPPPVAASKRWYAGDVVELRFDGGGLLTCTPNHPILTPRGWVAADQLSELGDVVRSRREQRGVTGVGPDDHERPTFIEQVAETLGGAGRVASAAMPVAPEDFHGDGAYGNGNVDVVWADRALKSDWPHSAVQQLGKVSLCHRCAALSALPSFSEPASLLHGGLATAGGGVGGFGNTAILSRGALRGVNPVDIPGGAGADPGLLENAVNRDAGYSVPSREGLLRFAGEVETDQLVSVRRFPFRGHVYNLQSSSEAWYTANRTVVHNCQCVPEPNVKGVPDNFPRPTGQQLFENSSTQEQNEMLGPEVADLVRRGEIELGDLVEVTPMETGQDFITQGAPDG